LGDPIGFPIFTIHKQNYMPVNQRFANLFNDINLCEKYNKQDCTDKIFLNQLQAAKDLILGFTFFHEHSNEFETRNRHQILMAQMQSGKTGTMNGVINILETEDAIKAYFGIEKYFMVTGMNDTGLHQQTIDRVVCQVFGACDETIDHGSSDKICDEETCKFYIYKNHDLRATTNSITNSLIFVDESHYGSTKQAVLTKFLERNGVDWKNTQELEEKNIYIVSISATPLKELHSDLAHCKNKVVLVPTPQYIGVSEFYHHDLINKASKSDFVLDSQTLSYPIINYIRDAYDRMEDKNGKKGVIIIRATRKKSPVIETDSFVKENFKLVHLNAKKGRIDYKKVNDEIKIMYSNYDNKPEKPIIVLIQGAYRAGMTIEPKDKDLTYMVYDNSQETTATLQGLMGRMCGYRTSIDDALKTKFYVNLEQAVQYAEWVDNGMDIESTPAPMEWVEVTSTEDSSFTKLSTKPVKVLKLTLNEEVFGKITEINQDSEKLNKLEKLIGKLINEPFNYIGEIYLKETYSPSVVKRYIDTDGVPSYRPQANKMFQQKENGRTQIDPNMDLGKRYVHLGLDYPQKRLTVLMGEIILLSRKMDNSRFIEEHKNTSL
jgi:hypothetical protein